MGPRPNKSRPPRIPQHKGRNAMQHGKLIVIEGLDGSGKATQAQQLLDRVQQEGMWARKVSFPNYDDPSSTLVKMYLSGELGGLEEVNAYAASSFFSVDRYASWQRYLRRDYEQGCLFIADRYTTSNMAHQTTKEPRERWDSYLEWLEDLEYNKMGLPRPDRVIYLDVEPEVSRRLLMQRYDGDATREDIHEANFQYLLQCRQAALYAAQKFGWQVIPCCGPQGLLSIPEVAELVWQAAQPVLTR